MKLKSKKTTIAHMRIWL